MEAVTNILNILPAPLALILMLDGSKFGRLFSWAITDETIGTVIQFFFDRARVVLGKEA